MAIADLQIEYDLSQIARGYINPSLVYADVMPVVEVPKETSKIPLFGKEAWRNYKTERALRAHSNVVSHNGWQSKAVKLEEHDIAVPIDYREDQETDWGSLSIWGTQTASNIINLAIEKKVATMLTDAANYAADHKLELTAGTDKWSDYTNSDPISDLEAGIDAITGDIAQQPNVLVLGYSAYKALRNHPDFIERIKYSGKGIVTPELIAEVLDIEKVVIGKAITVDDAGANSYVWNDLAILAYVNPAESQDRSVYEPSFGYTIRRTGYPMVDQYPSADGKVINIRTTDIIVPEVLGWDAGYLLYNVL
jgi:hypothetical protein